MFKMVASNICQAKLGPLAWEWLLWTRHSMPTFCNVSVSPKHAKALGLRPVLASNGTGNSEGGFFVNLAYTFPTFESKASGWKQVPLSPRQVLINNLFDYHVAEKWFKATQNMPTPTKNAEGKAVKYGLHHLQELAAQDAAAQHAAMAKRQEQRRAEAQEDYTYWLEQKRRHVLEVPQPPQPRTNGPYSSIARNPSRVAIPFRYSGVGEDRRSLPESNTALMAYADNLSRVHA